MLFWFCRIMSDSFDFTSIRKYKYNGKWESCYIKEILNNGQVKILFKNNGMYRTVEETELRSPTNDELNKAVKNLLANSTRGVSFSFRILQFLFSNSHFFFQSSHITTVKIFSVLQPHHQILRKIIQRIYQILPKLVLYQKFQKFQSQKFQSQKFH